MDAEKSDAQVKIRLPASIRDRLKASAALNRRSLMREIEFRVIQSMSRDEVHRCTPGDTQGVAA
ncbi:Arc family DNA-binding protein [Pseudorhodoferax sp. Leaf274]|uniref:Arc family DNA-binding protein n=1 Tax=Pseudorhodoferax sp. Leaf274 TaxID=1736318 RepID=UPI0009E6E2F7